MEYGDKRLAVEVEDHPFDYGSFEGVIPAKEYGAGNVIVWDCGAYSPDEDRRYSFGNREEAQERVRTELAQGKLSFFLRGEKLKGSFALVRTSSDKQWLLLKHKDRFASAAAPVLARSRSVLSGRSLDELAAANGAKRLDAAVLAPTGPQEAMPKKLEPMLAEIGEAAHSDPQWLYEPKVDGYRVIAFVQDGTVRLQSRGGIDLTVAFPEVVADLAAQAVDSMIIDGEIVALDATGQPSFNALQNRRELKTPQEVAVAQREAPVVLLCFDLLHFAGTNLRGAPYVDRRRYLSQCLLPSAHLQLVHASDDAEKLYAASLAAGFEGIVAKRKDSTYQPGKRSGAWLKVKSTQTAEFVVGGYTKGKGAREALGSLLLGYFSGSKLHFAGHVGSGLNDKIVAALSKRFTKLERKAQPFVEKPPLHRPTTWLDPEVVVEVTYSDWTPDGMLRAPVFERVRDDIEARTIKGGPKAKRPKPAKLATPPNEIAAVLQQLENKSNRIDLAVGNARIKLTNLDRIYWPANPELKQPAITKRDLIRYLAAVSPYMLPHLRDRPLTMIRMPEGITGERFYQKHWDQARPDFVETVSVYSGHKDEKHAYIVANNLPTLLWLGQSGTLEFHVWHSRANVGGRYGQQEHRLRHLGGIARRLGAELPGLPGVRHRSLYLFRQGTGGRRAGVEQEGLRGRPACRLLAARAAETDVAQRSGQDLGQDRPARVRADQSHGDVRRRAANHRDGGATRAQGASEGDHDGVGHAEADRQNLHRPQHERARQDAAGRLFPVRFAGCAGVHAADLGGAGSGRTDGLRH